MVFSLHITERCNLNCRYCFEGKKGDSSMSLDMIPHIIKCIDDYMKRDFIVDKEHIVVDFNGGEPLLEFNILKAMVDRLKKYGVKYFTISTNFTLIDNEMISFLCENDFSIQISIDGNVKTHDKNRIDYYGVGTYNIVYNNIIKFRDKLQKMDTQFSMVVIPETISDMYRNIEFLASLGFNGINASMCLDYDWSDSSIKDYELQIDKCGELYKKYYDNGKEIHFSLFDTIISSSIHKFNKYGCGICKNNIAIVPNGDILPCGLFIDWTKTDKSNIIGSIYNGVTFDKIEKYIKDDVLDLSCCEGCVLIDRCNNKCLAHNYRHFKDISKGAGRFCWLIKKRIIKVDNILDYFLKTKNETFLKQYHLLEV
jgi:uncharacterized protein